MQKRSGGIEFAAIEIFVEYLTADEVRKLSEIRAGYEKLSNDLKELEVKYNNATKELEDLRAYKQNIIEHLHHLL